MTRYGAIHPGALRVTITGMRLGVVLASTVALAACGAPAVPAPAVPRPARLPAPAAVDPSVTGAPYLAAIAAHLQPNWSQFLEDCRLRLPIDHALNDGRLSATLTLAIDRRGALSLTGIAGSGNADFDRAATGVVRDARTVEPPPAALLSDDDRAYLEWIFARDARQAGPASAHVVMRRLPVGEVTKRLIAQSELERAARRIADEPPGPAREQATQQVMTASLHEALGGVGGSRAFAIEVIGRARVVELAPRLRELVTVTTDTELRVAATTALGLLGDTQSVDKIGVLLANDLRHYPKIALAETTALVALGATDRAQKIVGDALAVATPPPAGAKPPLAAGTPPLAALAAHAIAFATPPSPVDGKFADWFTRGDARTRAAVCAAQPAGTSSRGRAVIARGLRDADATVRSTCADAASRQFGTPTVGDEAAAARDRAALDKRLRELARDRDRLVRARAIAALAGHGVALADAASDPAPEVRIAAAPALPQPALQALLSDADPDVRAMAVSLVRDARPEVVARAVQDPAAQVRVAAIPALADEARLAALATDDASEVATAALVQLVARKGRERTTLDLLRALAAAPAGSAERVRIAFAWLLGT